MGRTEVKFISANTDKKLSISNSQTLYNTYYAHGLFNLKTIRRWLNREGLVWPRHGANLWLVLTLKLWLRAYNIE